MYKSIEMLEGAAPVRLDYGPQLRTICLAERWGHSLIQVVICSLQEKLRWTSSVHTEWPFLVYLE